MTNPPEDHDEQPETPAQAQLPLGIDQPEVEGPDVEEDTPPALDPVEAAAPVEVEKPVVPVELPDAPAESADVSEACEIEAPPGPPRRRRRRQVAAPVDEYPREHHPAPVVTDQGVYGTLPAPGMTLARLRDYERPQRPAREQWTRVAALVLALSMGLWLVLASASQATSQAVAIPAIERTVESMTGLEGLLELHADAIRAGSEDPAVIPGFSATGVSLSRQEVQAGEPGQWHALLLERTASAIYHDGPGILSDGSEQSGAGTFSTTGGARLLMQTLSETNHGRSSLLLWPLGLVVLASAAAVLALGRAFARFATLGFTLLVAAVPALLVAVLGMGLVAFIGSDGSGLAQETNGLASDIVRTPLRNGVTLAVVGLVILILARIAGAVFARSRPRPTTPDAKHESGRDTGYDPAYD